MNTKYKPILIFQMILVSFGILLGAYNFIKTVPQSGIFGFLSAAIYLIAHITLVIYAYSAFKKQSEKHFRFTIYCYIALIGLQIIQSGRFISDYSLNEELTMFINMMNLIAFGNLLQFVNNLDSIKISIAYLMFAVVFKSIAEIILIVILYNHIQLYQILMALSVPILGISILVCYLAKN